MKFTKAPLSGVVVIEPDVHADDRGFFCETYRRDRFLENGIDADFVQNNRSHSKKGVLRGLHYQAEPFEQAKLISVFAGSIFDAVVDIRKKSPTYGKSYTVELSAKNYRILYIPAGFAHGFLALENDTEVVYKASNYYSPAHEKGILWNDPQLGIKWPDMPVIVSDKDKKHPVLHVR
jgi:dTDP-4-dehydrorhamnose 3,5-epimerase